MKTHAFALALALGSASAFTGVVRQTPKALSPAFKNKLIAVVPSLKARAAQKPPLTVVQSDAAVASEDDGPVMSLSNYQYGRLPAWVFIKDEVLSGLVVALASIPSSIAFANIAGVNPLIGIWSSVLLGIASAVFGGCPGLISGAAGVVVVPLAPLIATHGVAYMFPAVMLAASIQLACAALKAGKLVELVDDNVMKGFLNGLGLLLFKSQLSTFSALSGPAFNAAVGVAAASAAITKLLPMITLAVPSSLVAVLGATIISSVANLPLQTLSDYAGAAAFSGGLALLPKFSLAGFSAVPFGLATLKIVAPAAISIAAISVLETLLAGKVFDDCRTMVKAGVVDGDCPVEPITVADNGRLLNGLGFGTLLSGVFGGFGGCGLIPQTLLNMQSGGRGSLSSLSYAFSMALAVLFFAPMIGNIPLAALAGVMLSVAASTVQVSDTLTSAKNALSGAKGGLVGFLALAATSVTAFKVDMAGGIFVGVAITQLSKLFSKD